MKSVSSFNWMDLVWFLLVVALAVATRYWYLNECLDQATVLQPPFQAQASSPPYSPARGSKFLGKSSPSQFDNLVQNIRDDNWFGGQGPLGAREESLAHLAPGYPWLVAVVYLVVPESDAVPAIRWAQCGLGALAAGLYFVFARLTFGNWVMALLTGLLCAGHPLWIINTGQVEDGVVTSFVLALALVLGTRAVQAGEAFTGLLFGLSLAGLALVRAALLPFTFVALLWFLWRCRSLPRGWFLALLAALGFLNGLAPWTVRNYQSCGDFIPVANAAWLHLWIGNNQGTTGAEMDDADMALALGSARTEKLRQMPQQIQRYQLLAQDVVKHVTEHPDEMLRNRIWAGLSFVLGRDWLQELYSETAPGVQESANASVPPWLRQAFPGIVNGLLLVMLLLGLLGWRWTHAWRSQTGLATLAIIWVPLPYLLTHAETLWGPRLPLDGLLLCYVAFALCCLVPGLRGWLTEGPPEAVPREI